MLRAARELAPEGLEIHIFYNESLKQIPLYNEDVRARGDPEPVKALKEAIEGADALVISTPEYNHSVTGVLKNALDWASRPPDATPLEGNLVVYRGAECTCCYEELERVPPNFTMFAQTVVAQ